jgi:hypothetical protein
VTPLRRRMIEDMTLGSFTPQTIESYALLEEPLNRNPVTA